MGVICIIKYEIVKNAGFDAEKLIEIGWKIMYKWITNKVTIS